MGVFGCTVLLTKPIDENGRMFKLDKEALRIYYSGVSSRGVGKILGMGKSNVLNWIKEASKKTNQVWISEKTNTENYEMDEIYWFINKKERSKTRENAYIMTMISREPRQIVGFDVQFDKNVFRLQGVVDNAPEAENYATDGNPSYLDVVFPGKHIRNVRNKSDLWSFII